jgi:hypothetical protein
MISYLSSWRSQVRRPSTVLGLCMTYRAATDSTANRVLFRRSESFIQQRGIVGSMAWDEWVTHVLAILVHERTYVLDSERLGAILRGVALIVPESAARKHQRKCVGISMRRDHHLGQRCTGSCDSIGYEVPRHITKERSTDGGS